MKHQISIHSFLLNIIIQLFNIIYCEHNNEIEEILPLTIFFSGDFGHFKAYSKNFASLNNIISIFEYENIRSMIYNPDFFNETNMFKLIELDNFNDSFEIASIATPEHLDKFFMYQKRLNLTLKNDAKKELSVNMPNYKIKIQKITLQVDNLKKHPFDVVLLSSSYFKDSVNQRYKSGSLEGLYDATREIIEELKMPSIIILSAYFLTDEYPELLTTSFNRSGSNWKICSHDDGISTLYDAIMFYTHSIPPYTLEINITDCNNLEIFTQLANIVVTYKIKETTTTTTTTSALTTSRTTTKVTTSASTTSSTTTKVTTSASTTSSTTTKVTTSASTTSRTTTKVTTSASTTSRTTTKVTTSASTTSSTTTKVTTSASTTSRTTTKVTTSASTKSTNKSTATKSKTTSSFSTVSSTTITEIILNTKTGTLTLNEQFEYRDDDESNMSTIMANDEFEDDYINDDKCKKKREIEGIGNTSCVETANVFKVAFGIITCFFLFSIRK